MTSWYACKNCQHVEVSTSAEAVALLKKLCRVWQRGKVGGGRQLVYLNNS